MDVDSQAQTGRTALVRAVRSLDDKDDLALPEKIQKIWQLLSASKGTRLHSVEETILRWLFKQMTGASQGAEQVRRYPLTWTVLAHAFLKIPPQTLGRVLADRKFTAILRQALDDLYKSLRQPDVSAAQANGVQTGDAGKSTKKRKRGGEASYDIAQLRTHAGCMKTAVEIFGALSSLLAYNDRFIGTGSPEKKVGAEHIKSLFSSSTEETRDITAKLLWICDSALTKLEHGVSQGQNHWVGILTTLWGFHLHNKEDTYEFARHLYPPICSIVAQIKGAHIPTPLLGSQTTKESWLRQLEQFLGAQFIRPVRQRFAVDGSVEILKAALAITSSQALASCIVLWDVAARAPRDPTDTTSKLEHASWAQNVFAALLEVIDSTETPNKTGAIIQLLDTALTTGSIPSTATLREVCKAHALRPDHTDWVLLAKIVKCDSDVFLTDDAILENTLDAISSDSVRSPDQVDQIVTEVAISLLDAYTRARDLAGFIKQWFKRLCNSSSKAPGPIDQTVWFDERIRRHLARNLQSALSSTQLSRLLDWLDSQAENDGALLVILDAICAGIHQEDYIKEADSKVYTMALEGKSQKKLPSGLEALRWRVVSYLASWESSDEINRLWTEVRHSLGGVLKTKPLSEPETMEAFNCSCRLLLANHPRGKAEPELTGLMKSFLERLITALDTDESVLSLEPYLNLVFREFPRLVELPKPDDNILTDLFVALFRRIEQDPEARTQVNSQARKLLQQVVTNPDVEDEEPVTDALISPPLDAITNAEAPCGWTQPQSISEIWTLLEFPTEALTRKRRKRIMSSWKTWKSDIATQASVDPVYANAVLRLLVKVMQQPTFYELLLVKGLVSALKTGPASKSLDGIVDSSKITRKLRKMVENRLSEFASQYKSLAVVEGDETSLALQTTLSAVDCLSEALTKKAIDMQGETVAQLEAAAQSYVAQGKAVGWELRKFLVANFQGSYKESLLISWLEESVQTGNEDSVYELVETFIKVNNQATKLRLLKELVQREKLASGSLGPLLAIKRAIELRGIYFPDGVWQILVKKNHTSITEPNKPSTNDDNEAIDVPAIHERLASLLTQTETIQHFNHVVDILLLLLDKHANAMTQFSIERTLSTVVNVCSPQGGPNLTEAKAAGQVYDRLFKLVAAVIKRHRRRLDGHFPILLVTLQAMLRVLLADPSSSSPRATAVATLASAHEKKRPYPPWLLSSSSRLQARHAARFARLLTLVCEPSAASVASSSTHHHHLPQQQQQLDSATDAAKRAAGQDMYVVLETYIKLQLSEGAGAGTGSDVPRDVRKALEPGVYAILDVTPQGGRRVLNESLDVNGRALFRQMYGEYRKFGRWSGI
ncbi:hypothetical protein SLS62_006429 [Diatrype stigma]|uniref:Nucleolar 27S pre-rRNA processing Urb2/Npa2 C-terminal domain-containing protein n=1 Tax=Diatrype stigma TaxID=117547 RepID=A0AAN9UYJ2_9PEZI